ncbi:transposase [Leptodesmis sp.]|uniref:transposase n=1 Tax=Leptodesmis sp. TaxID=3100501 RepID=UPI0040535436
MVIGLICSECINLSKWRVYVNNRATLPGVKSCWLRVVNNHANCLSVPFTTNARAASHDVGIDVGLKSFLVTSKGKEVAIPRLYRKAEKCLKWLQRQFSKKKQGSKRRAKSRLAKSVNDAGWGQCTTVTTM